VAIWETGEWSEEWTLTMFITIPKKGDLKQLQITEQLLLCHMQARSFFGSHWKESQ